MKDAAAEDTAAVDFDALGKQFIARMRAGDHGGALQLARRALRRAPGSAVVLADAATCCLHLQRWAEAIAYAERALAAEPDRLNALDVMAHACWEHGDDRRAREHGLRALQVRDRLSQRARAAAAAQPSPPPSGAGRNLIAFSLFGRLPKYLEPAVLNAMEQPRVYPGWRCRFYVDGSVPEVTRQRLVAHGAEVHVVRGEIASWPGTMWRFLAYDDPTVDRVLFRDADSVVSAREAAAVAEWLASPFLFHMIRDYGSHTELLLAGLWGARRGALPAMAEMIADYLKAAPPNPRFADQLFLRQHVWPIARNRILQHDSVFGFLQASPFPGGVDRAGHVGACETTSRFSVRVAEADGTPVSWTVWDTATSPERPVCSYRQVVSGGTVSDVIPRRYAARLREGSMRLSVGRRRAGGMAGDADRGATGSRP